jgi:hypothetical protein
MRKGRGRAKWRDREVNLFGAGCILGQRYGYGYSIAGQDWALALEGLCA